MKQTIKLTHAAVAVAAAFLTGAGGAFTLLHQSHEQELREVFLVERLAGLANASNSLKLASSNDSQRLTQLLELQLDFNLAGVERLIGEGAHLRGPTPNLREAARRASIHYKTTGRTDQQRRADMLVVKLEAVQK